MLNVIDHPQNRNTIATLMAITQVYARSWGMTEVPVPTFSTEFDLGGLRTHPDLAGALGTAAIDLPHTSGLLLGYYVMVNHAGVIFALAISMSYMAVRLPPDKYRPENTPPIPGKPDIDFGGDWVTVNPWGGEALRKTLIESLAYVDGLI